MKLMIIETSLVLCILGSSLALAADRAKPAGDAGVQPVQEAGMLLASDSRYLNERSALLHKKVISKKVMRSSPTRQVREASPWWR
ncbi:hypothetical protein [Onishia niordana]|uniref:hypothetical protein n=1 Tax=Onishia niordana TaxID=2508711 RepID=UPI0010A06C63|nr:hypothetical protein [Halomonas niordiana]